MIAARLIYRHFMVYRRDWAVFVSGMLEPLFYLLSIGIGVGAMVPGFEVGGQHVGYAAFVAPAMLATSAMNGAVLDSTFNLFFRLKYAKLYDQVLATPMTTWDVALGEVSWSLLRGGLYAVVFLAIMAAMGFVSSWWALLAVPACLLIGFAFAAAGMWATTHFTSWKDFDLVTLAMMPAALFSGTFFPVEALPTAVRAFVEITPLYRGVVLCRELTTTGPGLASLVSVVYLLVMGTIALYAARRRLDVLLRS